MTDGKPKTIVLCGPTASGKSSLALALALSIQAEIINADSMQIYRNLDIGTAKPSPEDRRLVPHHLLDLVDPDQDFNAALFRQHAIPVITDILARNKVPLIVGGTGLYIKALLGGLLYCPAADSRLRRTLHEECREKGSEAMHDRLKALDPLAAEKIHARDRVRILRALEVILVSRNTFSDLVKKHGFKEQPFQTLKIGLSLEREELYQRINQRCLLMLEKGLLQETQDLINKGYPFSLKPLKSIGYRHMIKYLHGQCSWDKTVRDFQADTRHYAKRQMTWFKADPEINWIPYNDQELIFKMIKNYLENDIL